MKMIVGYDEDRAFPASEIREIYEEPRGDDKYRAKVFAKLRTGKAVRIEGDHAAEVAGRLGDWLPAPAGLVCLRAVPARGRNRGGHVCYRVTSEPVLAFDMSDPSAPHPIGVMGRRYSGSPSTDLYFLSDGITAWSSCHPETTEAWEGTITEAYTALGQELEERAGSRAKTKTSAHDDDEV